MSKITRVLSAIALVGLFAPAALAAPPAPAKPAAPAPAPPPAPPIAQGPPIPGVCVIWREQAIEKSKVGEWAKERLKQIATQVNAELSPEGTAIQTDAKAFEAARSTMDQATQQSKAQALQARYDAFRQKQDLRQRELRATQDKALNRIAQELVPIISELYQSHRCSILLDKNATLIENPDMNITSPAITALDGKIQQFPFEREHLDIGAPAAN
jgi:outer membrane protein